MPIGRRKPAKQDKRKRIRAAARELFAEHGVGEVTAQQVTDRADAALDTLYPYASTKAELLIMAQNQKVRRRHRHRPSRRSRHSKARPAERRHGVHPLVVGVYA